MWAAAAQAEPVAVTATPLPGFARLGGATTFGPLTWQGGVSLASPDAYFGGFSGLSLADDCSSLLAVSDHGRWFSAGLQYDEAGRLTGIRETELEVMRDARKRPLLKKYPGDAEALVRTGPGTYAVGFESHTRVAAFDIGKNGLKAPYRIVKSPKAIAEGPENGEIESLGLLKGGPYKDFYIAISERNYDRHGNIRGWLWRGGRTIAFSVKRHGDYDITDLAVLPDGNVLILERSYVTGSLPGMALRRFDPDTIGAGATIAPDLLFEGRYSGYRIDNMEGLAVCTRDGQTRLTVISDNNFNPVLQSMLLLQFDYRP